MSMFQTEHAAVIMRRFKYKQSDVFTVHRIACSLSLHNIVLKCSVRFNFHTRGRYTKRVVAQHLTNDDTCNVAELSYAWSLYCSLVLTLFLLSFT